jgi:tetratricopeptide (TPR) repeat protein
MAIAYGQGEYENCIALCDSQLAADSEDAVAYYFRGAAKVNLKRYREAKEDIRKALELKFPNPSAAHAMLLRSEAGLQETEYLISRLDSLAKQGFASIGLFANSEFDYLVNDQKFEQLKIEVDKNANPCKYNKVYKKLDFWLGEWDVYTNGNKSAESSITKSEGGCTLHEDYRTLGGFDGRSFNYYDPQDSLYTQIWIDKFNSIIRFKEEQASEGVLVMRANSADGNLIRMSYEFDKENDTVLQTMEASSDQGKTWTSNFTGTYRRKNTPTQNQN